MSSDEFGAAAAARVRGIGQAATSARVDDLGDAVPPILLGIYAGDRVTISLTRAPTFVVGRLMAVALSPNITEPTLIVEGADGDGTTHRIPWHAVAIITTRPGHPADNG